MKSVLKSIESCNNHVLDEVLRENILLVSQCFGGWTNVVKLCLSNPKVTDTIDENNFTALKQLLFNTHEIKDKTKTTSLRDNKINIENDNFVSKYTSPSMTHSIPNYNLDQLQTQAQSQFDLETQTYHQAVKSRSTSIASSANIMDYKVTRVGSSISSINGDIMVDDGNQKKIISVDQKNNVTAHNLRQFYTSSVTINVNQHDLVAFTCQCPCISRKVISKIVWITSKRLWVGSIILIAILLFCIGEILNFMNMYNVFKNSYKQSINMVYNILWSLSFIVFSIEGISFIIHLNVTVVCLVIQTFDFWFKWTNIFTFLFSHFMIENSSIWTMFILTTSLSLIALCVFAIDAFPISRQRRNFVLISYSLVPMCLTLFWFFFGEINNNNTDNQDTWNPIGAKYSQISLSTLRISSMGNLVLFILKPVISDIFRTLMSKICLNIDLNNNDYENSDNNNNSNNSNDDNNDNRKRQKKIKRKSNIQRSYCLYKRPKIHWKKRIVKEEYVVQTRFKSSPDVI